MGKSTIPSLLRFFIIGLLLLTLAQSNVLPGYAFTRYDLFGPPGSEWFGSTVTVLPNGNFVVTNPKFDSGSAINVGAVHLYNGASRSLISTLTGSSTNDQVGLDGVLVLTNGNYVVISNSWNNGLASQAGAVTFCNAVTGCSGVVSSANSLVGTHTGDRVGSPWVTPLTNGNYVVSSAEWDNDLVDGAGAVTWCSGSTGCVGEITPANSLVGSASGDFCANVIGFERVIPLPNGNYVVDNFCWDKGGITDAGAVTWCDGDFGCAGTITSANSLVGSSQDDRIGDSRVFALTNSNYVVDSPYWDSGSISNVGAVTWCDGNVGCTGTISSANSLVGSWPEDNVGLESLSGWVAVTPLVNGNYVVASAGWHKDINDPLWPPIGAVTWCNGASGCVGQVSPSNSLVGNVYDDSVGSYGVTALSNGNYVVSSPSALNKIGAATWCNGSTGCIGQVSAANSLVGSVKTDYVSSHGVYALTNGNYVVASARWHNIGLEDAGAVTLCDGATGTIGAVSASNSLVGNKVGDLVGEKGVTALTNGNYVVHSPGWDNGAVVDAGAATWCSGTVGCTGSVSPANSLVGSSTSDKVGDRDIVALINGNYVVGSPSWDSSMTNMGAATWCSGVTGCSGTISAGNSLVGDFQSNQVGYTVKALVNGDYVVYSPFYRYSGLSWVGAVTWANGSTGTTGYINTSNSVIGGAANCGSVLAYAFDPVNNQLLVGRRCENMVSILHQPSSKLYLPIVLK